MSDNGAEGASYEMIPYLGPSLGKMINVGSEARSWAKKS